MLLRSPIQFVTQLLIISGNDKNAEHLAHLKIEEGAFVDLERYLARSGQGIIAAKEAEVVACNNKPRCILSVKAGRQDVSH